MTTLRRCVDTSVYLWGINLTNLQAVDLLEEVRDQSADVKNTATKASVITMHK